jgi:tRNA (mo5U34)-methyltransferase
LAALPIYRQLVRPIAHWALGRPQPGGEPAEVPSLPATQIAVPAGSPARVRRLIDRVNAVRWYHTIDLGDGVITNGFADHREQLVDYRIPERLDGLRCLDVATFDGFWAFEMERRGAAEVVAVDVGNTADFDHPKALLGEYVRRGEDYVTGAGFRVAHDALGSHVRREISNVYNLSPQRFGTFDLVFLSDLLLHLRDPRLALERLRSVCHGLVIVADVSNPDLDRHRAPLTEFLGGQANVTWWAPSSLTLRRMMEHAGFDRIEEVSRFNLHAKQDFDCPKTVFHAYAGEVAH